jgi:hypothetical protein
VLVELTRMEQRYQAVLAVEVDGLTVTEVAAKWGGVAPGGAWLAASL